MKRILISINPKYVNSIINKTKKYEYRRVFPKEDVSTLIIYSTSPIKRVIGEVEVLETLKLSKEELWNVTKDKSGISKEFYDEYFKEKEIAYAYKLGKVTVYEEPKLLSEYNIKCAPQSFVYL